MPDITSAGMSVDVPDLAKTAESRAFVYSPDDHVLFTPAILYVCGGLDVDPVAEWAVLNEAVGKVSLLVLPSLLFDGVSGGDGPVDWGRTLLAVDAGLWPSLELYLAGIVIVDLSRRFFARSFRHHVRLEDPLIADRHVLIRAIGLSANDGVHFLSSSFSSTKAHLCRSLPEPDVVTEAAAYF